MSQLLVSLHWCSKTTRTCLKLTTKTAEQRQEHPRGVFQTISTIYNGGPVKELVCQLFSQNVSSKIFDMDLNALLLVLSQQTHDVVSTSMRHLYDVNDVMCLLGWLNFCICSTFLLLFQETVFTCKERPLLLEMCQILNK